MVEVRIFYRAAGDNGKDATVLDKTFPFVLFPSWREMKQCCDAVNVPADDFQDKTQRIRKNGDIFRTGTVVYYDAEERPYRAVKYFITSDHRKTRAEILR